jgi:hypothetical protein
VLELRLWALSRGMSLAVQVWAGLALQQTVRTRHGPSRATAWASDWTNGGSAAHRWQGR